MFHSLQLIKTYLIMENPNFKLSQKHNQQCSDFRVYSVLSSSVCFAVGSFKEISFCPQAQTYIRKHYSGAQWVTYMQLLSTLSKSLSFLVVAFFSSHRGQSDVTMTKMYQNRANKKKKRQKKTEHKL